MPAQSATTLRRGVDVLFALGAEEALREGGLGVLRVTDLVDGDKSQVSRILRTLEECGVVQRDPATMRYRLSWELFALANRAGDNRLVEAAPPLLAALVDQLHEAAYLTVLRGTDVLTVAVEDSARIVRAAVAVGDVTPAYSSSAGRALLVDHSPEEIRVLFRDVEFVRHARRTPRTVAGLVRRVTAAREEGVAVVSDEHEDALTGLAAPVRDAHGGVVAAVNVSGPSYRLDESLPLARKLIVAAAEELSTSLGAPTPTRPAPTNPET